MPAGVTYSGSVADEDVVTLSSSSANPTTATGENAGVTRVTLETSGGSLTSTLTDTVDLTVTAPARRDAFDDLGITTSCRSRATRLARRPIRRTRLRRAGRSLSLRRRWRKPGARPIRVSLAPARGDASSAGGPPLDPSDRDLLIKTVYGEASGEPALGQAGVTHAILNRVRAGGYGQGIAGVVKAPVPNPRDAARGYHEFSPWNTGRATEGNPTAQHLSPNDPNPVLARAYSNIGDIVDKAYSGLIPDQTGGATHYYGRMRGHPSWSPPLAALNTVKIGNTTFVGREHGPGQSLQTAGGYAGGGPVQLNDDLRRRLELMTQPRHGLADGGVTDLGSSDDVDLAAPDPFAESSRATPPEAEPPPDLAEAARAGKLGTISSYTPSWSEQIRYGTQEGLKALGAERGFAEDVGQNLSDIAGYTPGVGNVLSGNEAYRSYEGGHPYLAALHAAAAVPIPGVKGATKAVENVAENVAERAAVPSSIRVAKQLRRGRGAQPLPEETSVFAPEGLPESGIGPAPPSALGGWAKTGDPEVVWDPERKGWNLTGRKIEKGFEPTTLFDRPEPMDVPPVPQFELPRYQPARGVPQRTLDITSDPAVREQHLALIRRGMDMGALAWYNAEPIRQRFLQELGPNEGQASFQNFMDMVASTSPQQKVPENVRAASYYYWLNQNKLPVPERGTVPKIAYGGGQPVESPYGGLSLWQMNVNRVMNEGGLNPLENPKPPSFSQNLEDRRPPQSTCTRFLRRPFWRVIRVG